ncbi:putative ABC transporter substrate binding protein [Gordonia effusa NBRC 100432]|uniref:Putative ABC transporter substrate binding protein n=1 Tax=Gordonia effusa NBRC 100432 TaxID=1077974 RepID=H0QX78_9ACTN|nr:ABC transporter substrate-binding protein [Gordonia effusa]GAB17429.1 putative ABC transporter substrate binding protein [Gordonia effusa NBRC 100432]
MFRRKMLTCLPLAVVALLGVGCGAETADTSTGGEAAGYPITLANCGRDVTVKSPPQRIASLNQSSTEILLSLGLADRIAGTATWTDPVLPTLADANAKVKRIADNWPSLEAVLNVEPDFVTSSFTSTVGPAGTVTTPERLQDFGIASYTSPSDCENKIADDGDGSRSEPMTLDIVYREITELAKLTGVPDAGVKLIASLKDRAAKASRTTTSGKSALFWFANSESPYMAGCCGAPGVIATALGLRNVFADTKQEWPQINWEEVASRNPDVLILGDLTRRDQSAETAAAKIKFLESHPVTQKMDAVRNKRYITVTGAELNPSLRTVYGIESVAAGLKRLGFTK